MIYGYLPPSSGSEKETAAELQASVRSGGFQIEGWLYLPAGDNTPENLLERLGPGDILVVPDIPSLGRSLDHIMLFLQRAMENEIQVWTAKEKYRLGSPLFSKALAYAFALSADIARTLASRRTKQALERLKTEGKVLGRPKGRKNKSLKLSGKEEEIISLLNRNIPKIQIAKMLGVNRLTIQNFIKNNLKINKNNERFFEKPEKGRRKKPNALKTKEKTSQTIPEGI